MKKKEIRILRLVKNEPLDSLIRKMRGELKLLNPQIHYNLDLLRQKKLLKIVRYRYKLTIKARWVLLLDELVSNSRKRKDFQINENFYKNYIPKNKDLI